jgi:predicted nucleic acid-binding protein
MSREIFVDAGAWIALADADDGYHQAATRVYPTLIKNYRRLVTTNLVVAEAYAMLRRTLGHGPAMGFLDGIRSSSRIQKVCSTPELEREAEEILRQYTDQDFSFADAVSFALMRRRDIAEAFAFDHHFSTAGFVLVPAPS